MKHRPKIIAISETRIRKNKKTLSKIDIPGYNCEFTPTETEKCGTLLYIPQDLKYKNRLDLNISQAKELESLLYKLEKKQNRKKAIVGLYINIQICP